MRAPHLGKHHPDDPRPESATDGELTGDMRSLAQTLSFGGGAMTLISSAGLLLLERPPVVLIPAALVGMALMLLGIMLLVLFLPLPQPLQAQADRLTAADDA